VNPARGGKSRTVKTTEADPELLAGRYRLGERIGVGGMGEVFEAEDVRLERPVAIKLLKADLTTRDGMRERIVAEARLAARVAHPNVVSVIDAGVEGDRPFVVMERLSGRSLRDAMAHGPMEESRVRQVGLAVLRGLAAVHALDVAHRDIKPSNVLEGPEGTWKVADFGIAKLLPSDETLTATGEVMGSLPYLAPERADGLAATAATDVYAAGALLFEALAGHRPFEGDDVWDVMARIRDGRREGLADARPDVDTSLVAAIERAMAVDPADRFPTATEFAGALEEPAGSGTHADDTEVIRPAEPTKVLPGVTAAAAEAPARDEATLPLATPRPRDEPVETTRPTRAARTLVLTLVGAIVVTVLLVVLLVSALGGEPNRDPASAGSASASAPSTGATGALPPELEDSLDRLAEAVRP
jgi:eukaryotic-like serine/threonine-protein kinase